MVVLGSPLWVLTDDSGNGQTGDPLDAAWAAGLKEDIDLLLHSTTNPTISPAQIIDEVVTARGEMDSLDDRLDALLGDGAVIAALGNGPGGTNLVQNDDFLIWSGGDVVPPDGWTLLGGDATVERAGAGLSDTVQLIGDYCLKLTADTGEPSAAGNVIQQVILAQGAEFDRISSLISSGAWSGVSPYVVAGVWVRTDGPGTVVRLDSGDGGSSSSSSAPIDGSFHFIACRHLLTPTSTALHLELVAPNDSITYWSGAIVMFGENLLSAWQPSPKIRGSLNYTFSGDAGLLTDKFRHVFARPTRIEDTRLSVRDAPTGATLIVDVNHCDDDATPVYTTMYTTKPAIEIAGFYSDAIVPDGDYRQRCFGGFRSGGASKTDRVLSVDIDQVGSTVPGSELSINIYYLQYARAIESLLNS